MVKITLALWISLLLLSCDLSAQNERKDTLFLSDGTVLSGWILNPNSTGTIRIKNDGGLTMYILSDKIDRMSLSDERPAEVKQLEKSSTSHVLDDRIALTAFGGLGVPVGAFGSTDPVVGAYAATGWQAGAGLWVRISDQTFWTNRFFYSQNGMKEKKFEQDQSLNFQANFISGTYGVWRGWNIQTGIAWKQEVDENLWVTFEAQIGLARYFSPSIRLITDQQQIYTLEEADGSGISSNFEVSVIYKRRYQLGLGLNRSNPLFVFSGTNSTTIAQPIRILNLRLGLLFFP